MRCLLFLTYTLIIIFALSNFNSCASRGRPSGGPVDKIPPEIIYTFPQPDSLNVRELDRIEIRFNERMDESSVVSSIFTSPPLEYETDWSGGDELTLELQSELARDRTYLITIGTGAMDARQNKLSESFQLAFSTGSYLEQGGLSGQVYGLTAQDNFSIFAYRMTDPDSLNPTITRADYLTQPSEDGRFMLQYLPLDNYRVFVVEDQNRNLILDASYERVGIPFRDVILDSTNIQSGDLNFRTMQPDTLNPMLTGARALFNNKVLLRFSEPIEVPNTIQLYDTLSADQMKIVAQTINSENESQIFVYTEDLVFENGYRIQVEGLVDLNGNRQLNLQSVDFIGSEQIDTTSFELIKITPGDSAKNVRYPASINLEFSIPVDTLSVRNNFYCMNSNGDTLSGTWQFEDLMMCAFIPNKPFLPDQEYRFDIYQGQLKSLFNLGLKDSLIRHTFFMISSDEFGTLSGNTSLDSAYISQGVLELYPLRGDKQPVSYAIKSDNTFFIEWLLAGEYQLGGYIDLDNNKNYSPGNLFPFSYAEPVFLQQDTIKIRKRWEFGGIYIQFPELSD